LDEFLLEFATAGRWKTAFVLVVDARRLAGRDCAMLYTEMTEAVVDACARQRPQLRPKLAAIRHCLRSVMEPRNPHAGAPRAVGRIARQLNAAWRRTDGFAQFVEELLTLPRALGFADVALFVDNIDAADIVLEPARPFTKDQNFVFVAEEIKKALAMANFVVAAQSVTALYDVLSMNWESTYGMA
jgi:hypothetical protein